MKKYLCFFILVLGISTSLFAETWSSSQGQVFTFTNNTSISLKKDDLESIAKYFYKWKKATMVLSLNKGGIPLCTAEIETEKYDAFSSDEYVPYLRSWITNKIDNKNQQMNFLGAGFLVSSTHKLPNGSITQYGALRNSGYVKFDDDMIIKAGGYTGNLDNTASTVPKSTTNSCNAAYLYLYVTENYDKLLSLPVPSGLELAIETFKKDIHNLPTLIDKHNWDEVTRIIKKYKSSDFSAHFWRLIKENAPLKIWTSFNSFSKYVHFNFFPSISSLDDESFFYICNQLEDKSLYYLISKFKDVPNWKILKILENRNDYIAKRLTPYFYDYENISQLEKLRTEMGDSIETFYLSRIKLSDNNYYPSLLEKLCLKNENKILDELFKTKIKYALIIKNAGNYFEPFEERLYFIKNKSDIDSPIPFYYSPNDNTFVYYENVIKMTEDNYMKIFYADLIFKINYYFSINKDGSLLYRSLCYSFPMEIENGFYIQFNRFWKGNHELDKNATYPAWLMWPEENNYKINFSLKTSNNDTILMYAIQQGNSKFANKLIKQGIDIKALNNDGKTALDIAIEVGDKKTEKELRKLLGE